MIGKIKRGLNQRKVKIFLLFLICSFLAWFISKLSETYTSNAVFDIEYTNVPDSLSLKQTLKKQIDVKLRASGFQFLAFNFYNKKVKIDVSAMEHSKATYFITQNTYRKQIERQMPTSMILLDTDSDTLFFDFYEVHTKKIPVLSNISVDLGQNYMLDGNLTLNPDSVILKGPKEEIDSIEQIETLQMVMTDITGDFSDLVALQNFDELENTIISANSVRVIGKVFRFSEKIIDVPITVINLPEGVEIKTFPNTIAVLCKGKINDLKNISPSDFTIISDYNLIKDKSQNLEVKLDRAPKNIQEVKLMETQVEYILKRS